MAGIAARLRDGADQLAYRGRTFDITRRAGEQSPALSLVWRLPFPFVPREIEGRARTLRPYPRPMNGILVAMMVMNCTLAHSGRLSM